MTDTELSLSIKTLKSLNIEQDGEISTITLGEHFDNCLKMQNLIENSNLTSNDAMFQEAVVVCIKSLEKCTTMVNELELFCSNETIDEIQTSSIKYLLLPALLGILNINHQSKDLSERLNYVKIAEVYFRDFLLRCKNYELSDTALKYFNQELNEDENISQPNPNDIRQRKIQQFKLKKELEEKEKNLKAVLERSDSEEYVRNYYLALIEKWALVATEEVENIKREKDILKSMPNKDHSAKHTIKQSSKDIVPLKPIIITKNKIQKQVFGLGYPSIPVMTIDDFYYQRFHDQIQNQKAQPSGMSLQEKALRGEESNQDAEEIEKEKLLDKDDPIALMKARQWDDWKDDNPRGSGNRKNKG